MGVDFAYSIEDLSGYTFSADGYSIEKDGQVIEDTPSILKEWGPNNDDEESDDEKTEDEKAADRLKDGTPFEASGLIDYVKNKKLSTNQSSNQSNAPLNTQVTNQNNQENTLTEEQQTPSEKIEQYQEEFDNKIKDLFIGNTFYDSNISDPILNYDWITITPKAPTTTTADTSMQNTNQNQENNQENNQEDNKENNQEANQ